VDEENDESTEKEKTCAGINDSGIEKRE